MERTIKIFFPEGKRVFADYKGFVIETDQPVYSGGDGKAPAPFDLFLASIATCAGLYVLSFCQNRGISTKDCFLVMDTEKNSQTKRVEKISIEVQLPSHFPEKYRSAVIKAVDSCPVKAHILNPPSFHVTTTIAGK